MTNKIKQQYAEFAAENGDEVQFVRMYDEDGERNTLLDALLAKRGEHSSLVIEASTGESGCAWEALATVNGTSVLFDEWYGGDGVHREADTTGEGMPDDTWDNYWAI